MYTFAGYYARVRAHANKYGEISLQELWNTNI